MKQIQKGFTLIELMIVVAIIGILAAVAIPAYQDYIVKSKLSRAMSTLDPVKTALAMYFQEQGGFPVPAAATDCVATGGLNGCVDVPAAVAVPNSIWTSLGFGNYPALPLEIKSMALHSVGSANNAQVATGIAIILTLQNIKAGTVDGALIAVSPNVSGANGAPGSIKPTSPTASNLANTDTITGASAINWYYGCALGAGMVQVDAVVKNYFKNGNVILKC